MAELTACYEERQQRVGRNDCSRWWRRLFFALVAVALVFLLPYRITGEDKHKTPTKVTPKQIEEKDKTTVKVTPIQIEEKDKTPVKVTPKQIDESAALKEREEAVVAREKELEEKKRDLAEVGREIDGKIVRLAAMQNELKSSLAQFDASKEKEFRNLVKVYSEISATKLAPILGEMDDETTARILKAMKTDIVAKLLPKLEKEKAIRVSILLGRLD